MAAPFDLRQASGSFSNQQQQLFSANFTAKRNIKWVHSEAQINKIRRMLHLASCFSASILLASTPNAVTLLQTLKAFESQAFPFAFCTCFPHDYYAKISTT